MFKSKQNPSLSPRNRACQARHGGAVACPAKTKLKVRHSSPMPSRQAKLQEDTYFRVMRILQDNPDLTQRELAEKLGISVGGLNYCLKALIEKGLVKMKNFANSKNKFGYVYVLTPTGMVEKGALTHRFLQRKIEEYEALKSEIEALRSEAGRSRVRNATLGRAE
jgi:EPS-associated MarR family transcriptional regulator